MYNEVVNLGTYLIHLSEVNRLFACVLGLDGCKKLEGLRELGKED